MRLHNHENFPQARIARPLRENFNPRLCVTGKFIQREAREYGAFLRDKMEADAWLVHHLS